MTPPPPPPSPPPDELATLKDRVRKLGEEKSHLQLITRMMAHLSTEPGLETTVQGLLDTVLESVGGTNLTLYFFVDSELFVADLYGRREKLAAFDNPLAQKAYETRTFLDVEPSAEGAPVLLYGMSGARTWVCPLEAGKEIIGVLVAEGVLALEAGGLRAMLPLFFNHAALVLRNEISSHTGLKRAYDELAQANTTLKLEVEERQRAERAARQSSKFVSMLLDTVPTPIFYVDTEGRLGGANRSLEALWGLPRKQLLGKTEVELRPSAAAVARRERDVALCRERGVETYEQEMENASGAVRYVVVHKATFSGADGNVMGIIAVLLDITERRQMEAELGHARKLEAVGQLAAGLAHEINTPAQYVADSVRFLGESFGGLAGLFGKYKEVAAKLATVPGQKAVAAEMAEVEEAADLAYLEEEVPAAAALALKGVETIAQIVSAMKELAHHEVSGKSLGDLNHSLESVLTVARSELADADLETELCELPLVPCHVGDINQVFLHLVVNAAHAVTEVKAKSGVRGRIRVRTSVEAGGEGVRIDIEDTGGGIPEAIRGRIYDPFFTTKPVGKGSGQGLAVARAIVVDKHGGSLTFESTVGKGTTFTVRLPVAAAGIARAA